MLRYPPNTLLALQRAFDGPDQSYRDETFGVKTLLQVEEMLAKDIPVHADVPRLLGGYLLCDDEIWQLSQEL
jgi:hypothetical protein